MTGAVAAEATGRRPPRYRGVADLRDRQVGVPPVLLPIPRTNPESYFVFPRNLISLRKHSRLQ